MKLIIIRHGSALPKSDAYSEENRPLTDNGQIETKKIGRYLLDFNIDFSAIWSSPYKRAIQTKDNIFPLLENSEHKILNELLPFESPEKIILKVNQVYEENNAIAIISHQPLLGELVATVLGTSSNKFAIVPASLIELSISKDFNFKLLRFISPSQI